MKSLALARTDQFKLFLSVIVSLAFVWRLTIALAGPWRPDEIVYIDWLGQWFRGHFFEYFFQIKQTVFPPQSPVFGNPPLAMWLMALASAVSEFFGQSALIGARLVNVFLGSLAVYLTASLGKRLFSHKVGLVAAATMAATPFVAVNNATAYLDTLLVSLIIASWLVLESYRRSNTRANALMIGVINGLALLTKASALPFVLLNLIGVYVLTRSTGLFRGRQLRVAFWSSLIVPLVLWPGARDFGHIYQIISYFSTIGKEALFESLAPTSLIYLNMMVSILPLASVFGLGLFIVWFIKDGLESRPAWWLVLNLAAYFSFLIAITGPRDSHHLVVISPALSIISALGLVWIFKRLNQSAVLTLKIVVALSFLAPALSIKPAFASLYVNSLITKNQARDKFVLASGGEGLVELAAWLKENVGGQDVIASGYENFQLAKYIDNPIVPFFGFDGLDGVRARGANWVVVTSSIENRSNQASWRYFSQLAPNFEVSYQGLTVQRVYKINYDDTFSGVNIKIGHPGLTSWRTGKRLPQDEVIFVPEEGGVKIDYSFPDEGPLSWFFLESEAVFDLKPYRGIALDVYGDGLGIDTLTTHRGLPRQSLKIDLMGENRRANVLRYSLGVAWPGWRRVYIPFELFQPQVLEPDVTMPGLSDKLVLKFALDSRSQQRAKIGLRNIVLVPK